MFVLTVIVLFSEAITYSCFVDLMQRMNNNFPHGGAMDTHFANMRSLIQVCKFKKKILIDIQRHFSSERNQLCDSNYVGAP